MLNMHHAKHISLLMLTATVLFFAIVADIQLQHSWCPAAMPRYVMLSGVEDEMQAVGALHTHEHLYQAMVLLWWVNRKRGWLLRLQNQPASLLSMD